MQEIVSIIIPTYRRAQVLEKAIDSVKLQSFKDWKVIVVDDNHPDHHREQTQQVMLKYELDPQVMYIQHEQNLGACAARNTGWKAALGEYIAFLDDDDVWRSDKLEKQVNQLKSNSAAMFCYCDMYLTYQGLEKEFKCLPADNMYQQLLEQGYGICTSALLIKRQALVEVDGFDDSLPSMQDYDLLLRLAKQFDGKHLREPLLTYQLAEDGISCNPLSKVNGHKAILCKYKTEFESLKLFKGLSRQYESLGDFELRSGHRLKSAVNYSKAISYSVMNLRVYTKLLVGFVLGKKPLEWYLARRQARTSVRIQGD